jgi:hypothetical protein
MKSDAEIKEDVIRELRWDPQVSEPDAIGVAVKDGAVTLVQRFWPISGEDLAGQRQAPQAVP